jgi:hypothetical protein
MLKVSLTDKLPRVDLLNRAIVHHLLHDQKQCNASQRCDKYYEKLTVIQLLQSRKPKERVIFVRSYLKSEESKKKKKITLRPSIKKPGFLHERSVNSHSKKILFLPPYSGEVSKSNLIALS